jgi:hypothetical protein
MTPPKPPVQNPVEILFENGIILTTISFHVTSAEKRSRLVKCETKLGVIYCAVFMVLVMLKLKHIGSGEREQLHRNKTYATQMNCNRLKKIPVGFVAWMAALQICWRRNQKIQSSSLSHQIALIIMNTCSIKMQQFLPTICHAPMSQYIVPFAPHHSQGTYRQYGNIMLCTI